MLSVTFERNLFICRSAFESRILGHAGFTWSVKERMWYTGSVRIAVKVSRYFDAKARKQIHAFAIRKLAVPPLSFPKNLKLKPFQEHQALPFALSRNRCYLALDPGLGKTIVAAVASRTLDTFTVFITPPSLAANVENEFVRWGRRGLKVARFVPKKKLPFFPDVLILPDSVVDREEARQLITQQTEIVKALGQKPLLIVDEAHRFKSPGAARTRALLGGFNSKERDHVSALHHLFPRQIWMSGTPAPNFRPIELHPLLSSVAPTTIDFMDRDTFGERYCDAQLKALPSGEMVWDYSGASRLTELQKKVQGPFMLRLKKADVLKDLPPKTEEVVIIGKAPPKLIKMERTLLKQHSPQDLLKGVLSDQISTYQKELGLLKAPHAIKYIKTLLEGSGEALVVFAHHIGVMQALYEGLKSYQPLLITGAQSTKEKQRAVETFQKSDKHPLILANYIAGGLGFTLTKASRALMVEFSWVPAENDQAGDRLHRIGQTRNVLIEYLVFQDSIDRTKIEANLSKKLNSPYL